MKQHVKFLTQTLFFLLIITLTACGTKNGGKTGQTSAQSEYAYQSTFTSLDMNLDNALLSGDKIYYVNYESTGEAQNQATIISESDSISGREMITSVSNIPLDTQNSIAKLFCYDINTKQSNELPYALEKGVNVGSLYLDINDNLLFTTFRFESTGEGGGRDIISLIKLNADYQEVFHLELNELSGDENFYINQQALDATGNFCNFYFMASDNNLYRIDADGNLVGKISVKTGDGEYIERLVVTGNNNVYLLKSRTMQRDNTYANESVFIKADFSAGSLGEEVIVESTNMYFSAITSAPDEDAFFASAGNALVKVFPQTGKIETQFLWINADINSDSVNSIYVQDNQHFKALVRQSLSAGGASASITSHAGAGFVSESNDARFEIADLTRVKSSELPKKTVITFGSPGGYLNYQNDILTFNRQSNDYRIEVVDYQGDRAENIKRFTMELASGNAPDIIDWPSYELDFMQFGAKGHLADLGALIDKDSEIKREDFLPGVIESYQQNGKIYALTHTLSLITLLAAKDAPNIKAGWNTEEFIQFVQSRQSNTPIFDVGKNEALEVFSTVSYSNFVNWETGECSFDSPAFIGILEMCNSFPQETPPYSEENPDLYIKGQKLFEAAVSSMRGIENLKNGAFGGHDFISVGFPINDDSNGALIMGYNGITVINAASKNIDEAWQFLRTRYTYDYQSQGLPYDFPVNAAAFDKQCDDYLKSVETEKKKDENKYTIYPTAADAAWVKDLIANAHPFQSAPQQITNIVKEEGLKYFNGTISAQDAAKNIQNRVKLYVDENS